MRTAILEFQVEKPANRKIQRTSNLMLLKDDVNLAKNKVEIQCGANFTPANI